MPPEVCGAITAAESRRTAAAIAATQLPDGAIPWEVNRHVDPWNHVEAAMGMDVGGEHEASERAYRWLFQAQRADGSWAASYRTGEVEDATADVNFTAYVAVGVWHHFLATLDEAFLEAAWEPVERALGFALEMQAPGGEMWWARDGAGRPWRGALVTSSSSIHMSLGCGIAAARHLGRERPQWQHAKHRLGRAIAEREFCFEPKQRYAMDWYYPVLCGALDLECAKARIAARWDEFVAEGLGVRCVSDRPWVTTAETCELVLALDSLGLDVQARTVFSWLRHLRGGDGSYWTGLTFPERELWPAERPTWTSAAVLLAADALASETLTAGLFRGESFVVPAEDLEAAG